MSKLSLKTLVIGALVSVPFISSASTSIVNLSGDVTSVNTSASTITITPKWLFGVSMGETASYSTATTASVSFAAPVAYKFCSGKSVVMSIASTTKLTSIAGQTMTLSQVKAGDHFNATASYIYGTPIANSMRFTSATLPTLPSMPSDWSLPSTNYSPTGTLMSNTSGLVAVAGKVVSVNSSSFQAQISWIGGAITGTASSTQLALGTASHVCPTETVTVSVNSNTKIVNFMGMPISLSNISPGALFFANLSWNKSTAVAQSVRLSLVEPTIPAAITSGAVTVTATPTTVTATSSSKTVTTTRPTVTTTNTTSTTSRSVATTTPTGNTVSATTNTTQTPATTTRATTVTTTNTCNWFSALFGTCKR